MNKDLKLIIILTLFIAGLLTLLMFIGAYFGELQEKGICERLSREGFEVSLDEKIFPAKCKIVYKGLLFSPQFADKINLLKVQDIYNIDTSSKKEVK